MRRTPQAEDAETGLNAEIAEVAAGFPSKVRELSVLRVQTISAGSDVSASTVPGGRRKRAPSGVV